VKKHSKTFSQQTRNAKPVPRPEGEFFKRILAPTENFEPKEIFRAYATVAPGSVGALAPTRTLALHRRELNIKKLDSVP
jgi:hypothetical protein